MSRTISVLTMFLGLAACLELRAEHLQVNVTDLTDNQWAPVLIDVSMSTRAEPEAAVRFGNTVGNNISARIAEAMASNSALTTIDIRLIRQGNNATNDGVRHRQAAPDLEVRSYREIVDVVRKLRETGHSVSVYARVSASGVDALVDDEPSLIANSDVSFAAVDVFHHLPDPENVARIANVIGQQNVRVFITSAEAGSQEDFSLGAVRRLVEDLPRIDTYLLTIPEWRTTTVSGFESMLSRRAELGVYRFNSGGLVNEVAPSLSLPQLSRKPMVGEDSNGRETIRWSSELDDLTPAQSSSAAYLPVPSQSLVDIQGALNAYAKVVRTGSIDDVDFRRALTEMWVFRDDWLSGRERTILSGSKFVHQVASDVLALSRAIQEDSAAKRSGNYTLLRSHTLEQIGRVGLNLVSLARYSDSINPEFGKQLGSVKDIAMLTTGLAQLAGGSRSLEAFESLSTGTREMVQAQLLAKNVISKHFAWVKPASDMGFALAHAHGKGFSNPDVAERFWDSLNSAAWTGVGVVSCGGSAACTLAVRSFGEAAAKAGRASTSGAFNELYARLSGTSDKILSDYVTLQTARLSTGQALEPISKVYGEELLRNSGFSKRMISDLDNVALRSIANQKIARPVAPAPSVESHRMGQPAHRGVKLEMSPIYEEADLSELDDLIKDEH